MSQHYDYEKLKMNAFWNCVDIKTFLHKLPSKARYHWHPAKHRKGPAQTPGTGNYAWHQQEPGSSVAQSTMSRRKLIRCKLWIWQQWWRKQLFLRAHAIGSKRYVESKKAAAQVNTTPTWLNCLYIYKQKSETFKFNLFFRWCWDPLPYIGKWIQVLSAKALLPTTRCARPCWLLYPGSLKKASVTAKAPAETHCRILGKNLTQKQIWCLPSCTICLLSAVTVAPFTVDLGVSISRPKWENQWQPWAE